MPIYDFECPCCGKKEERFLKIDRLGQFIECSKCGTGMDRIFIPGHGGIQTDTPNWINNELRGSIQGDDEKPIVTRKDLARVTKEKKIEPIEKGHRGFRMI